MKIKTTEEIANFITGNSTMVEGDNCNYYYIPYWFASTEDPLVFEILNLEKLPDELVKRIKRMRGEGNDEG